MRVLLPSVILLGLVLPAVAIAARRPDPLPDQAGCAHYRGTSSGNDPSVRLDVVLCPHGDGTAGKVEGQVQWSSLLSGWNLRAVEGQWDDARLTMKDLAIVEQRPAGGFMFCTIDAYALARQPSGELSGTYDSAACRDHASVTLSLVPPAPGGTGMATPGTAPATPGTASADAPAEPHTARSDRPTGCGCTASPLFVLPLMGLRGRRRRRTLAARRR